MKGLLRVAALETRLQLRTANRDVLLLVGVAALALLVLGPALLERGVHPDAGLYRVEAEPGSPLLQALGADPKFHIAALERARWTDAADLYVERDQVFYAPTEKGAAGAREVELAVRRWLNQALETERDQAAAFPVEVNVLYQVRGALPPPTANATGPQPTRPQLLDEPTFQEADPTNLGLRPHQVEPPFPLRGLLLTFAYVVPLTFVAQLYAGSLLDDRTRQRGVLVLASPHGHGVVLAGKSLPYVALTLAIAAAVTFFIGSGPTGFLAALSFLGFVLAASLLFGLLVRSPRELTFLIVSLTVLLNTFLFLPPLFSALPAVAFLSPVSVILASLEGQTVGAGFLLYSTLPLALATFTLAVLSRALYREETLFTPAGLVTKIADAAHRATRGPARLFLAGVLSVPLAFGLELFVLVLAVSLDLRSALIAFLIGGAFVEEGLKGLVAYARISRGSATAKPLPIACLVGAGFFVGEKAVLGLAVLGFGRLPQGSQALAAFGIGPGVALVLAPLLLHAGSVYVTARASRRARPAPVAGWFTAALIHASYNLGLLAWAAGGDA